MSEESPVRGRLDSWKEIAAYLNRDVRTVIRWEQEKSLPIHRVPGGKRQAVFAYKDEIEAWLAGSDPKGNHANGDHANGNHANGNHVSPAVTASEADAEQPEDNLPAYAERSLELQLAPPRASSRTRWKLLAALACLLGIAWIARAVLAHSDASPAIRPLSLRQLTDDARVKNNLHSDGATLYFNEGEGARSILVSVPGSGGPIRRIETPFSNVALQDVSSDGKTLLFTSYEGILPRGPLWTLPVQGGTPRRVDSAVCDVARWSPDSRKIACLSRTTILIMDADGSNPRPVASFSKPVRQVAWTPDGERLRYVLDDVTAHTSSQWEIGFGKDGKATQPQELPFGPGCCVDWTWTRDGRAFAYTRVDADGKLRLMMQTSSSSAATELPVSIGDVWSVVPGSTGNTLYLAITDSYRGELFKFNAKQNALQTFLPGLSAAFIAFSPDGEWITYSNTQDYSLWRSRVDGSDPLELVKPPMQVQVSSWSPDGRKIAFMGQAPGKPFRIYLIDRDGGPAVEASEGNDNQGGPSWSPDGKSIVYGNVFCEKTQDCWIRRLDLAARKTEIIPGSSGLRTARWSPDGKYFAALRFQARELMLFDVSIQRWRVLADSVGGDNINWSNDSQYVYVDNPREKKPIVERIRVRDGHRTTVVSLDALQNVSGTMSPWFGLTPDDSPILVHMFTAGEIYELDWTER